jgi:hypothetical protein
MKGMNAQARSIYLQHLLGAQESEDPEQRAELDARLVVSCALDPETGDPAFLESDIPMLMSKAGDIIGPLATKALILSGLDGAAEERLGKDFSASAQAADPAPASAPSDDSSSPSPEN